MAFKACLRSLVFRQELFSILSVLRWAESDSYSFFLISADSLSAIYATNKFDNYNYLILDIIHQLQQSIKIFLFNWAKGHCLVEDNELADQLEKSAVTDISLPHIFLSFPALSLKIDLKHELVQSYQQRWTDSHTGQFTKPFFAKSLNIVLYTQQILIFILKKSWFLLTAPL